MARRKRRIKKYYTISVTSDYSGKKSRIYRCRFNFIRVGIICSFLVMIMAVGLTYYWYRNLMGMEEKVSNFKTLIEQQEASIIQLGNEKANVESENVILGDMLSKAEAELLLRDEQVAETYFPSLFPIDGAVLTDTLDEPVSKYIKSLGEISEEDYQITVAGINDEYMNVIVFKANQESDMIAAGAGNVISVGEDALFGAYVVVDHGNGYESIYRSNGDLKVDVGDSVFRGQLIFIYTEECEYFGFQIAKDGSYVDPLNIINTNG